jgi:hypothetical protein
MDVHVGVHDFFNCAYFHEERNRSKILWTPVYRISSKPEECGKWGLNCIDTNP